jgi:dihydroflavonol-4-reductase
MDARLQGRRFVVPLTLAWIIHTEPQGASRVTISLEKTVAWLTPAAQIRRCHVTIISTPHTGWLPPFRYKKRSMRILITGATGLLGNNIVRQAIDDGHDCVVLVRDTGVPKSLESLKLEIARGDITDQESLLKAADGVDAILHSAAYLHIGWKNLQQAIHINRDGTANIVEAARRNRSRLVHVSTVNTLAIGNQEGTVDETASHDGQVPCTYVMSKRASEKVVVDAANEGLDAVVVHPGFMLGPWDWKRSSGRMVIECGKRWTPLAPSGGCSVCDVRDVARGILSALEKGTPGRHYILGGENLSYFDLWTKIAKAFGKRPPTTVMRWPARFLAGTFGDFAARISGNESDINSAALAMSSQFHCYSSQRAIDELGFRIRPAEESIQAAIKWFREVGFIPNATA